MRFTRCWKKGAKTMEVVTWFVLTIIAFIGIAKLFIGLAEHDSPEYARQRYKNKMKNDPNVWWEY